VGARTSRVVLTTDPSFVAGAVAVPQIDASGSLLSERDHGVVRGDGVRLRMKWLTADLSVETGTHVLTAEDPLHRVPQGFLLGQVTEVSRGRGPYPEVLVEPSVNAEALEFVTILLPPEDQPVSGPPSEDRR